MHDLATVGALRINELVAHSVGMVEKPMTIQLLAGPTGVTPYELPKE